MIFLLLFSIFPVIFGNLYPVNPDNITEFPTINSESCPCSHNQNQLCRGGIYVDHYYNAPYSGYPANYTYLPPESSIPVIIDRLTTIRQIVKEFVQGSAREDSPAKKAIYVKNNFSKVKHLLFAVNKASKTKEKAK